MGVQDFKQVMAEHITKEEKRLGVGSPDFMERHNEIMDSCNKQLLRDLMMEQREGM